MQVLTAGRASLNPAGKPFQCLTYLLSRTSLVGRITVRINERILFFDMRSVLILLFLGMTGACFESGDSSSDNAAAASVTSPPSVSASGLAGTEPSPVVLTTSSPALTKELVEALSARPMADVDYEKLDGIVRKGLVDVRGGLEDAIGKQEKIDYDRIHSLVLQSVVDNLKPVEPSRYQFICDVNERWIYRCNLQTGEIECFSMSSNKLRLLSSVR